MRLCENFQKEKIKLGGGKDNILYLFPFRSIVIRFIKILFLSFLLALLNGTALAASFEEVVFSIGIVSNDLEEDLKEERIAIVTGEYDSVGAGGSDNNDNQAINEPKSTQHNSFSPPLELIADAQQKITLRYKQYRISLQKSLVISPLFILYCCAKDAFLS